MSQSPSESRPTVRTPRLLLRPLCESDRAEYVRVHNASRDHLAPWSPPLKPGWTYDDYFTDDLARALDGEAHDTSCRRAAELLPAAFAECGIDPGGGGASRRPLVAFINLTTIERRAFQCANMGWRAMAEFTGHGLASEAVVAMLDLAFAPPPHGLGLHRVQANVIPRNERSLRLAARAGFRREGLALRMLFIAGKWEDHVMFAKLADEHQPAFLKRD